MQKRQTRRRRLDPNTVVLLKQISIGLLVLIAVSLLFAAIWYGTRVSALTITTVTAEGGETIASDAVVARVQKALTGTYLGLVPRRFAWLYPEESVREAVAKETRIHDISIQRVDGTTLHITYDEYVPYALWCSDVNSDGCLFLDETGYAFAPAPSLSGGAFLRFITTGQEPQLAKTVASSSVVQDVVMLTDRLDEHDWFVSHVELDQAGDAFLSIVSGGELKVNTNDPPEQVVENLLVVLSSEEFAHLEPGTFQYIDLRFGNKIFVQEKPAPPEGEAASSTTTSTILAD